MTPPEFTLFWAQHFPETPPINPLFKHHLKSRWLRIHSLPEAKRYAETAEEWAILLGRQNTVFTDLIPINQPIYILSGIYSLDEKKFDTLILNESPCFKTLIFKELPSLNLGENSKDWYDEGVKFTPYFAETTYTENGFDSLLKSVANDEWRCFFIDTKTNTLIAPYDGGLDIIFASETDVDFYKHKYRDWLSDRADNL